jgi:CheY-like chemotaxis protein
MARTITQEPLILWVDDDADFIGYKAKHVEKGAGCTIDFASTIETAIDKLSSRDYDLIITDIEFHGVRKGIELVMMLRNGTLSKTIDRKSIKIIPILIMSGAPWVAIRIINEWGFEKVWVCDKYISIDDYVF